MSCVTVVKTETNSFLMMLFVVGPNFYFLSHQFY